MNRLPIPDSNDADLRAFDTVCERLSGFDEALSFEYVDGFLTALAAGPRLPETDEWLAALCGDAFERAFADPEDHAQALHALQTRLKVLCRQLDPEALLDDPDQMRLLPLLAEVGDLERARWVDEGVISADDAALMQTGAIWAEGFLAAVEALPAIWTEPEDDEAGTGLDRLLDRIVALTLPVGGEDLRAHVAEHWPDHEPDRDDLVAEAGWAVQDLRLYWVDHAPRPVQRRVEPVPGRNDPCPCGSGRKFKRCHGA